PRVTREPPRLRLRGLTLATSPAGVFVFHSNQKLDRIPTKKHYFMIFKIFLSNIIFISLLVLTISPNSFLIKKADLHI
ncbi:hypothetical protein AAEO50_20270, partial [Rossellomorea oryzaecorticis]